MKNSFINIEDLDKKVLKKYKNILIITSNFHKKKNYLISLVKKLKNCKEVNLFGNVKKGASVEDVYKIIGRFQTPDLIIGIGGGSVMDVAKTCSCFFDTKYIRKDLTKIKISKKIKSIMVPTILGSGAENSREAILKYRNNKKKAIRHDLIKANFVYVDLNLIKTASIKIKCEALYDCFSHAIETYISNKSNVITQKRSVSAIKFILKVNSKNFFKNKKNLEKLSKYSFLMGLNLVESSTCLPHRIQYSLSEFSKASHAQGIIALHKGWLSCSMNSRKFLRLCNDLKESNVKFYKKIFDLRKKLGINYSLNDIRVSRKNLLKITTNVNGNLAADPLFINRKSILNILENAF